MSTNEKNESLEKTDFHVEELSRVIEALLFVSGDPLSEEVLCDLLRQDIDTIRNSIEKLSQEYESRHRGIRIRKVRQGFQMVAHEAYSDYIEKMGVLKGAIRLSKPLLETLSIIAYRQPISIAEISEIRGVDASYAVKQLQKFGLVRIAGYRKMPGRPKLYGTTPRFLDALGLTSIKDLPPWESFLHNDEES